MSPSLASLDEYVNWYSSSVTPSFHVFAPHPQIGVSVKADSLVKGNSVLVRVLLVEHFLVSNRSRSFAVKLPLGWIGPDLEPQSGSDIPSNVVGSWGCTVHDNCASGQRPQLSLNHCLVKPLSISKDQYLHKNVVHRGV